LKKTVKLPCLRNSVTDFDEIWHSDTYWPPQGIVRNNFEFLKIQDGGRPQCALPAGRPHFSMYSIWGMVRA